MATEAHLVLMSAEAAADLSAKQYTFVKVDSNGKIAAAGTAGELVVGVLQNAPLSGEVAAVAIAGKSKIVLAGTLSPGILVKTDTAGKATTAAKGVVNTSDAGAASDPVIGSNVVGILMKGGAANEIGEVLINLMGAAPTTDA